MTYTPEDAPALVGTADGFRVEAGPSFVKHVEDLAPNVKPNADDEVAVLLRRATRHDSRKVQTAAKRALAAVQKVRDLIAEDERLFAERRKAREEVERLQRELAAAKARLRGKPAEETDRVDPKTVRAWAAEHGVECPRQGRVPKTVLEQYQRVVA